MIRDELPPPPFAASRDRTALRPGEPTLCPGCGQSHWLIGRMTAECAVCATALPLFTGGGYRPAPLRTGRSIAA